MRPRPWSGSSSRRWCCCPKVWRQLQRGRDANRLQTSLNLALGSALASIGLTIPAVAVVSIVLRAAAANSGSDAKEEVLLALTLFIGVITLGTGRTTVLQGIVHLVIFRGVLVPGRGAVKRRGFAARAMIQMTISPLARRQ